MIKMEDILYMQIVIPPLARSGALFSLPFSDFPSGYTTTLKYVQPSTKNSRFNRIRSIGEYKIDAEIRFILDSAKANNRILLSDCDSKGFRIQELIIRPNQALEGRLELLEDYLVAAPLELKLVLSYKEDEERKWW